MTTLRPPLPPASWNFPTIFYRFLMIPSLTNTMDPRVCQSWTLVCPPGRMAGYAFDKNVWCENECSNQCGGYWSNPCCKAEGGHGWEECEMRCRGVERRFTVTNTTVIKMIETQQMRTYDELRELDIEETPESLR